MSHDCYPTPTSRQTKHQSRSTDKPRDIVQGALNPEVAEGVGAPGGVGRANDFTKSRYLGDNLQKPVLLIVPFCKTHLLDDKIRDGLYYNGFSTIDTFFEALKDVGSEVKSWVNFRCGDLAELQWAWKKEKLGEPEKQNSATKSESGPSLRGGTGGAGGHGDRNGRPGGIGEAAKLDIEDVHRFDEIRGGTGGRGGTYGKRALNGEDGKRAPDGEGQAAKHAKPASKRGRKDGPSLSGGEGGPSEQGARRGGLGGYGEGP
ncbi:hypothetical protein K438DRAFT_1026180 [Mycena galopus ATCC 62051]|nr:hypothetical protein K438DRAFT_1026180 [Mycena galopus ATCC 62051]